MNCYKPIYRNTAIVGIFIFCLTQLSGCSFLGKSFKCVDGAPDTDIDESKISDAVPREEPYHPYGTKDYAINGHYYHVLKSAKGYSRRGYASWYGSKFHGNHTSTQEQFNLYSMTAASKELPLPCYAQVTNLHNGKKIVVRVNDRGPFRPNRIIDLSYAAAKKLDFVDAGTTLVKVVAIDPKTWGKTPAKPKIGYAHNKKINNISSPPNNTNKNTVINTDNIYLQIGAFSQLDNAKHITTKLGKLTDKPTSIKHHDGLYKVQIGPMDQTDQSSKLKQFLEENGFSQVVIIRPYHQLTR